MLLLQRYMRSRFPSQEASSIRAAVTAGNAAVFLPAGRPLGWWRLSITILGANRRRFAPPEAWQQSVHCWQSESREAAQVAVVFGGHFGENMPP